MWRLLRGKKRQDRTTEGAHRRDDALAATARAYRATPEPAAEEATAGGGDADRPGERSPRAAEQGSTEHPQRGSNSYDVIDEQHLDEVGAGIAPEQDEDDLPPQPLDHRPLSRDDRAGDALDRWSQPPTGCATDASMLH